MKWAAKIAAKVVLSRVAGGYGLRRRLGIFRHGEMHDPEYAIRTVRAHIERVRVHGLPESFVALELGPGDSVGAALIARCFGATRTYLVDVGRFATAEMSVYIQLQRALEKAFVPAPDNIRFDSIAGFLTTCNATYAPNGIESLRSLPSESVDFIWSQAVLEHVRLSEFRAVVAELYRVAKPGALSSHRVDLRDHLAEGLNNLRFSRRVWESSWMAESGFYTNRIRCEDMLRIMRDVGFEILALEKDTWNSLPIARGRLDREFRSLPDDELLISSFDVLLRR